MVLVCPVSSAKRPLDTFADHQARLSAIISLKNLVKHPFTF